MAFGVSQKAFVWVLALAGVEDEEWSQAWQERNVPSAIAKGLSLSSRWMAPAEAWGALGGCRERAR